METPVENEATGPAPIVEGELLALIASLLTELGSRRALDGLRGDASLERDLGLGSLERVELVARIESRFGRAMPESTIGLAETVEDLLRLASAAPIVDGASVERSPLEVEAVVSRLPPLHDARALSELLERRAQAEPDRTHLFLKEDDRDEVSVTFGGLYRDGLVVAAGLSELGVERGQPVAIMLPTSYDFFCVFMAIQMLGAVPVPLYPPMSTKRLEEYSHKQASILRNAEARVFVTLDRGRAVGELLRTRAPTLDAVVSVEDLRVSGSFPRPVPVASDDPALIQYTSGSTGDPKGVLLTHENLLANLRVIGKALDVQPDDVGVSWLPLYHDMGLIGAWLMPLYFGIPVSIFSPIGFLSRPERWLWAIHARRASLSAAPNFAYELAIRKVSDETIEALDLSCWRAALNGAEPIAPGTMSRFAQRFAPAGFDSRSLMPVYGLAENTLLLTAPPLGRGARTVRIDRETFETTSKAVPVTDDAPTDGVLELVSAGFTAPSHELEVWDEEHRSLSEGLEGRVVFRGPSMMRGYYRNPEATSAVMQRGFIDSGDRGFLLDGELFVTGRAKDLIIRAGRNLVPHDLEQSLSSIDDLRKGAIVVFGVADEQSGTEKLVVVAEVKDATRLQDETHRRSIESCMRERLMDSHGLPIDELRLVPPRTIPKTSSGKLRRSACRDRFVKNELSGASSGLGFYIRMVWASAIGRLRRLVDRIARDGYAAYVYGLSVLVAGSVWLASFVVPSGSTFRSLVRFAAKAYLRLSGIRVVVRGDEVIGATNGPVVIVVNHASYLDPLPLIAALPRDFAFVVKGESARWPFVGRVIRRLGHLFVDRFDAEASASSTRAMLEELQEGRSVVIFPEATFSSAAGIRPFKLGAFQLAAEAGATLLPVALVGTRRWLRDGQWKPRRVELRLEFGQPRHPGQAFSELALQRREVEAEISRLAGEPQLDLVAAGFQTAS